MNRKSAAVLAAGLLLLALAAWWVPTPRLCPPPDLPDIAPFTAADRVALVLPDSGAWPAPDAFGLVHRARTAGAAIRVFAPGESLAAFAPTRIYEPCPGPFAPTGYHPEQWPALPAEERKPGHDWHQLVLTPAEQTARNTAVLAAAQAIRDSGSDNPQGSRAAAMLSRARRAEIYRPLPP
ncbi:MAG: hypothetical protein KBC66_06085 [Kiritimatiellae bacterium]|jgi:hypothetical protein|nr:hypothetical protein [Kiritimatiellia bacterium]NLD90970.1 hypothetical protein [Lentisphaerota bacterium]HOU21227.1 hypothetical protein [Kiritimatiellia bacterium]HPC20659.1 hypothetical protein [Kiritimatiellia bacterium]HQN80510.1 hypothetical protein [Kiritimatiellia bacterium]